MKTSPVVILALVLGCGGSEKQKQVPTATSQQLSSGDQLIGCYHLDGDFENPWSQWAICITANGNGQIVAHSINDTCWPINSNVFTTLTPVDGNPNKYTGYRYSAGPGCSGYSRPVTILCSSSGCSSFQETGDLSNNAVWDRLSNPTDWPCIGSYSTSGFTVTITSGAATLSAVPSGSTCWLVGDTLYDSDLTAHPGGYYTASRFSTGGPNRYFPAGGPCGYYYTVPAA